MKKLTAKQVIREDGHFSTKISMSGYEFNKLDSDIQANLSGGTMWLTVTEIEDNETVILDESCVIIKSGNKIKWVVMTDETCAGYERCGNIYINANNDEQPTLKTVKQVLNYHNKIN
jgi:hypothetical protein